MRSRYLLSAAAILMVCAAAQAQQSAWTQYTSTDEVTDIVDVSDYVWLGTHGGLIRLTKATGEKTLFTNANSSLPNNDITALALDGRGDLWVATRIGGLARYDGTSWTWGESTDVPFFQKYIHDLVTDAAGNVWAAVADSGIARYDGNVWTMYSKQQTGVPLDRVFRIAIAPDGDLWGVMLDRIGVVHFDGTGWTHHEAGQNGLPLVEFSAIGVGPDGSIWVGTSRTDAVQYDGTTWKIHSLVDFLPSGSVFLYAPVTCLLPMSDGALLAGGTFGLARYHNDEWTSISLPDSIGKQLPLVAAGNNTLECWVGTSAGVLQFNGTAWRRYATATSGLQSNNVFSVLQDRSGRLWTGYTSIMALDGGEWINHGTPGGFIRHMALDSAGAIWISPNDLRRFDGTSWTTFDTAEHRLRRVNAVAVDAGGTIWIGGQGGVGQFDGATFTKLEGDRKLPFYEAASLAFDREGKLWAVSPHDGVGVFDGTTWTHYTKATGLPSSGLRQVVAHPHTGDIWISTFDVGVMRFDGTTWTTYNVSSGALPHNVISAIAISSDGTVWVGAYQGLTRFDGTTWETFTVFNSGLPDNVIQALWPTRDNGLWVGTLYGGVARYAPATSGVGDRSAHHVRGAAVRVHPNPAGASAEVQLTSEAAGRVRLILVNALGEEVAHLFDAVRDAGSYQIPVDFGALPAGRYHLRAIVGDVMTHMPVVVVR